jgi:AcrR family transcriptional regulator
MSISGTRIGIEVPVKRYDTERQFRLSTSKLRMTPENFPEVVPGPATPAVAIADTPDDPLRRPQRADAQRNRQRVLDAAFEVFAVEGADAAMDSIARRACVGVGTVYRHFATKEALIEALVQVRFEDMRDHATLALERDDAWAAIVDLFEHAASLQARDRVFAEMNDPRLIPGVAPVLEELLACWAKLIARAKAQGTMREDFEAEDIPCVMCGLANVVMSASSEARWRRYLDILINGLRADALTAH